MLVLTVCRVPTISFVTGMPRHFRTSAQGPTVKKFAQRIQRLSTETQHTARRVTEKTQTLKQRLLAPAGDTAFSMGKGLVAGASIAGLGALCYYGLGMSNEVGAIDKSALWSEEVRKRIRDTYYFFGGSIITTAASAIAVTRSPALMNMMMRYSLVSIGVTFIAMIGSGMVCMSLPYREGFGTKHIAWLVHTGIMGAVIAPITLLGGPIMVRAAWYTAGIVGALSMLAMSAPSEKFLYMGAPLAMGFGLVLASSIGGMFLPPTSALGAGLYSISVYGGLVLFGMFILYDTQKVIHRAENHPPYSDRPYDPINGCIGIYSDTLNIFIRVAMLLSNSAGKRK